jgi:hypothetical protein
VLVSSADLHLKEDRVSDRQRRSRIKPHAIPGETTEEGVAYGFHLLVVAEHPLSWVTVVYRRREETLKRVVKEGRS